MTKRLSIVATVLVALLLAPVSLAAETTPSGLIEGFHQTLLSVMKDAKTLGLQGRYDRMAPVVDQVYAIPAMTRVAVGPAWGEASAEQQAALSKAFSRVSAATYAFRFKGFSGQSFETIGEEDGPRGTRLVRTKINNPGKDSVNLTYVVKQYDGRWQVVDVLLADGISELAVRRSEYRQILETKGAAGLIDELNGKADALLIP